MKQISEVEEKPFTSSLNISPEACCSKGVGAGGVTPPPPPLYRPNSQLIPCIFNKKDDITVILLLGVSFMVCGNLAHFLPKFAGKMAASHTVAISDWMRGDGGGGGGTKGVVYGFKLPKPNLYIK
jgi:hypothetical protein